MNLDFDMAIGRCYRKNIKHTTQIMNQLEYKLNFIKDIKETTNQQLSLEDSS